MSDKVLNTILSFRIWFNCGCASFSISNKSDLLEFSDVFKISMFKDYILKISEESIKYSKDIFSKEKIENITKYLKEPNQLNLGSYYIQFSNMADLVWSLMNIDEILAIDFYNDFLSDGFYKEKYVSQFTRLVCLYILANHDILEFKSKTFKDLYSEVIEIAKKISSDGLFIHLVNVFSSLFDCNQFDLIEWRNDLNLTA